MEEHSKDDNSGYPDLVAGGNKLIVWHIFKNSFPLFRSPPFGPLCPCKDSKAFCTLLYVALLLLVAKGFP